MGENLRCIPSNHYRGRKCHFVPSIIPSNNLGYKWNVLDSFGGSFRKNLAFARSGRLFCGGFWRTLEGLLAEREGFEPSVRLPVHVISSHAPSATRSPFHNPFRVANLDGFCKPFGGEIPGVKSQNWLMSANRWNGTCFALSWTLRDENLQARMRAEKVLRAALMRGSTHGRG